MLISKKWLIVGVLLLGFLIRFFAINKFPVGFNADEASFGYDAYSILKTGKDQWGMTFPIVLKSFGDFKSPLYAYLTVPSVLVFGLTKFAVRLPDVLVGTFSIYSVYLLSGKLGDLAGLDKKRRSILSLSAAALLAISPWHIMMSRGAFEANLITFFLPSGVYLFLKGLNDSRLLIFSALFLGLNLFTYHSAKLITPLVVLGLIIVFKDKILKLESKHIYLSLFVFLVFFVGLLYTFKLGGGSRISERSITQGVLEEGAKAKIASIQSGENPFVAKILHNKYQVVVQRFVSNYEQYFSFKFFSTGAEETTYGMLPVGVLYPFEGMLFLGLIYFLAQKKLRLIITLLIFWLLIAPLPAALATGVGYSGNRAEGMIPVLQILEAFGVTGWLYLLGSVNKKVLGGIVILFSLIGVIEVYTFVNFYFYKGANLASRGMLYGSLEAGKWLAMNSKNKNVIVSRDLSEPQIFVAFASKWDPADFQKSTKTWGFDDSHLPWVDQLPSYSLGKYTFKSIDWKVDAKRADTIIIGKPEEFPKDVVPLEIVSYPWGEAAIYAKIN